MRVALIQMMVTADKVGNINTACEKLREAAVNGADIAVLPEMFCCPYQNDCFCSYGEAENGPAQAALSALAADQHRQARRLSAAYFLLSGLRYWPTESLPAPMIPSFWGALRQRHQAEQQSELSYRLAADDTDDSTLLELYDQLAEGCRNHCRQLRNLLEQNCL